LLIKCCDSEPELAEEYILLSRMAALMTAQAERMSRDAQKLLAKARRKAADKTESADA